MTVSGEASHRHSPSTLFTGPGVQGTRSTQGQILSHTPQGSRQTQTRAQGPTAWTDHEPRRMPEAPISQGADTGNGDPPTGLEVEARKDVETLTNSVALDTLRDAIMGGRDPST